MKSKPLISKREREVLSLVACGKTSQEISKDLYITKSTVKNHLLSIFQKLNARGQTNAVSIAYQEGLLPLKKYGENQLKTLEERVAFLQSELKELSEQIKEVKNECGYFQNN